VDGGTIEVVASHPRLAMVGMLRANVEIDGDLSKHPWGTHSFPVEPGTHEVAVSYPWLFMRRCARRKVDVDVGSGETVRVVYRARMVRYLPGSIRVEKAASTG
jgi:hypothetical protein